MPRSVAIGARIPEELNAGLGRLAAVTGRSKSWLVAEALRSYVASEQQFIEAVEEGLHAMRAGELVDHKSVVTSINRRVRRRGRK